MESAFSLALILSRTRLRSFSILDIGACPCPYLLKLRMVSSARSLASLRICTASSLALRRISSRLLSRRSFWRSVSSLNLQFLLCISEFPAVLFNGDTALFQIGKHIFEIDVALTQAAFGIFNDIFCQSEFGTDGKRITFFPEYRSADGR